VIDIIDRLDNEETFVDAIDDAVTEIKALRTDNAALEQELARVRAALAGLETDYIADDEYGKYCEWCSAEADGGKLVHASDCPFALVGTEEER